MFRAGRVTASTFHTVCHADPSQLAASCIKGICYLDRHLTTPAMRWGNKVLSTRNMLRLPASRVWQRSMWSSLCETLDSLSTENIRRLVFLPMETCCDWHGEGSLEVKCPYILRDEDINTASEGATCLYWRELEVACKPCILLSSTVSACCLWTRVWRLCCVDTTVMPLRANNEGWKVLGGNDAQSLSLLPSRVPAGVWRSSDSCRC